jgi:predicted transcriptional regulator
MANMKELKKLSGLTDIEFAEIDLNTQIIGKILEARKGAGITQKELESVTGIKQSMIARIETNSTDPRLTTILRMLEPLGMKLAVVPK